MKKEMLKYVILVMIILNFNIICAEELNLKITAQVNDYASDFYLITNPHSELDFDSYDMKVPSSPGNYSLFYSSVLDSSLSIDSWDSSENPRTINLTFLASEPQTGDLNFSWGDIPSDFVVTFKNYGNDSTRTNLISSFSMNSEISYTTEIDQEDSIYVQISVSDYEPPTTPVVEEDTSSGGGGGGAGFVESSSDPLIISTKLIEIYTALELIKERKIEFYNSGNTTLNVALSNNLADYVQLKENNLILKPGEKKLINLRIIPPEKEGVYTGKIIVKGIFSQEILITLNVNSKELLFDATIVVSESNKIINLGDKLSSQITLIPMADDPRVDVTLNYLIKDFNGRTFLSESETILIEGQKSFKKDFSTFNLPEGNYVLALELIYPNGVATSSSHFEIKKTKSREIDLEFILIILGAIFLILILIVAFIIAKSYNTRKKRKK